MDERNFYTESPVTKKFPYTCPKCRQPAEFPVRWLKRTKKKALPAGASDLDRAKFAKARDSLVRVRRLSQLPQTHAVVTGLKSPTIKPSLFCKKSHPWGLESFEIFHEPKET